MSANESTAPPVRDAVSTRADEDRVLFERFLGQRDPVDREVLLERFLPLARSLASRYLQRGEPFDDVFQVACIGLLNAIDRFDVARGRAFSSFAVPTISGEIKRYYRDRTWSVHVPRDLQDLTLAVERTRSDLETDLARTPTVGEIAQRLSVDDEDVVEALQAQLAKRSGSLDAPRRLDDDSGGTVGDHVPLIEDGFFEVERRADLWALARVLKPRERLVLRLRFEGDLTQEEIGIGSASARCRSRASCDPRSNGFAISTNSSMIVRCVRQPEDAPNGPERVHRARLSRVSPAPLRSACRFSRTSGPSRWPPTRGQASCRTAPG
jgi:RNA polymerase sigma-B factor